MADNTNQTPIALNSRFDPANVVLNLEEKPQLKICDMCGHANPEHAGMCKMCSNYLE